MFWITRPRSVAERAANCILFDVWEQMQLAGAKLDWTITETALQVRVRASRSCIYCYIIILPFRSIRNKNAYDCQLLVLWVEIFEFELIFQMQRFGIARTRIQL